MIIRVKGFKIFKDRHSKLRCYHRASGLAVDLIKFPLGSAEFIAECGRITNMGKAIEAKPGTLSLLIKQYKKSPAWQALKPKTIEFYEAGFKYVESIGNTPLIKFTRPLIVRIRDKALESKGWYFANQLKTTLSMLFSWAVERGLMTDNPAKQVRKIKRPKGLAQKNRPWTAQERETVLNNCLPHEKPIIATMLYIGLDPCDAVVLPKNRYKDGAFDFSRQKTGNAVWVPAPKALKNILDEMPAHNAITFFANSLGKPWTKSGLDSIWHKKKKALEAAGQIEPGLTLKGLRHTRATMLREMGATDRDVADALGQESESMGRHYSKNANIKNKMQEITKNFDKKHSKIVKLTKKGVKP